MCGISADFSKKKCLSLPKIPEKPELTHSLVLAHGAMAVRPAPLASRCKARHSTNTLNAACLDSSAALMSLELSLLPCAMGSSWSKPISPKESKPI